MTRLNQEPGGLIPVFNVINLFLPRRAYATVPVNIAVKVNNTGNKTSSDIVKIEVDTKVIGTKVTKLRPGEDKNVVFTWIPEESGTIDICGQINGSVMCKSINVRESSEFPGHQQCIVKDIIRGTEVLREVQEFGRTGCAEAR